MGWEFTCVTPFLILFIIILIWSNCQNGFCPCRDDKFLNYNEIDNRDATSNINAATLMPIVGQSVRTNYFKNKPMMFTPERNDDNSEVDSFDVIVGPVNWKNDPRDAVGLTQTAASRTPLGDEDLLRDLVQYGPA